MMDNDVAKNQLEFLMGGFKVLCQSEVQFSEMLTLMEETLKRVWITMTEAQFLGGEYSEKDKLACVSGFLGSQAKCWFHKEQSWIPFNSWSQVKDGLLLTFGNNRDKK
ncbi:hypothetical protein ISN44_As01g034020 [Arabidopsis suecica]|nr:hypothetical protein ISN44_As01g034020 [Arabidopsis suecica]